MTPVEELRKRLDELGIEHYDNDLGMRVTGVRYTRWDNGGKREVRYEEWRNGTTRLDAGNVTPEQAIAATVGIEADDATMRKLHERMNAELIGLERTLGIEHADCSVIVPFVANMHEIIEDAATVGAGTCTYVPDETGFTWWDENDVEHYEEYSASDECYSASCDKCGFTMIVGDEGWFDGWDEITEWTEEDGSEHKGYVLTPRFKFCPNCGRRIEVAE